MASENPSSTPKTPLYPKIDTHPTPSAPPLPSSSDPNQPSSSSLYPSVDMKELPENLFPDSPHKPNSPYSPSPPPDSVEEVILSVPGAILHLIDKKDSVELACGDFSVMQLRQGNNVVAILARVGDEIQWPLARDEACVKLDHSHYFFSMRAPKEDEKDDDMLNYGLTFASKGQDKVLKELDELLEKCSSFSVQKVDEKNGPLDATMANEMDPSDLKSEVKKEEMEQTCSAYWSTLAPNVEDYSGTAAKLIAAGSGQLVKGILWCGDVTMDRLKWGNEVLKKKMEPGTEKEVSPETLKRIKRVKKVSQMTEKVAGGILSGVLKVTGYFTSSVVNSKAGKKFFSLMPGEMALATLDGFSKICDAFEVSGRNVMSTSSTVTTELVSHKYGKETAKATNEGLDAAGHAIGAAWTVFKLRQAMNPKSVVKPTALSTVAIKNATEEMKNKALKDVKAKNSPKSSPKKSK
ncbi:senescence/dehydration-associated protein At4g35985, chloroplastic-like [Cynara cardunculus var. scolymus]|uniref:Senescence domain-containing protein n=1 Tax=Cynara cardunculus var. scolymus TaxID=59895 RepID=A0A103XKC8_CYNCS|nr:senescence/dehydration-associated protein At4g35985, chloroplastic-like [Cynara cardunculus var. scolymus]KVH92293.1 hypothetical protein Ccrd_005674 [Cynara cardunculus var. scolymus]